MDGSEKLNRVVDARMKLKARFEEKIRQTPSVADDRPQGKGALNRHGMPSLPVGQVETAKWPVLDLGIEPDVPLEEWQLKVDGAVEHPVKLTRADFMALPQTEDTSDFHCVTTAWKGSKWISRIEFLTHNKLGFWEERGYPNTAYPWRNDRYSE